MSIIDPGLSLFITPVALAISLVYTHGLISRKIRSNFVRNLAIGGMLGLASVYALHHPFELSEGFIVDLRNLFVGLAAGLFGFAAGFVALVISATTRLMIGGGGAWPGVIGMTIAASMALLWHFLYRRKPQSGFIPLLLLGLMISCHILYVLSAPPEMRNAFFLNAAPALFASNLVSTYVIGRLVHRERMMAIEEERLQHAASTDALTHLLNRRSAEAVVEKLPVPRGDEFGRAMAYFDIDNFKPINDDYGHGTGDQVLLELSRRIQGCLRPEDIFARLGGDEFLIVLPEISIEDAAAVSERFREAIARTPFYFGEASIEVRISLGVKWRAQKVPFAQHVAEADKALYTAKARGRNCVVVAQAGASTEADDRHKLLQATA